MSSRRCDVHSMYLASSSALVALPTFVGGMYISATIKSCSTGNHTSLVKAGPVTRSIAGGGKAARYFVALSAAEEGPFTARRRLQRGLHVKIVEWHSSINVWMVAAASAGFADNKRACALRFALLPCSDKHNVGPILSHESLVQTWTQGRAPRRCSRRIKATALLRLDCIISAGR